MSASTFLIAHGEKLVVAAVAGGCALVLWSSITDPTIRPKDDQQQIEAINAKIDGVFKSQNPPVMKEPRPYLDQLLARVGESAPLTPTMAWLSNPPDKGRIPADADGGSGPYIYIYELLSPTVAIEDAIGSLRISVATPETVAQGAGRRISSESEKRWIRDDKGKIENGGRHLGVQVQIKIGDTDWKPLALPGASRDGVLPLSRISQTPVTIPTPEPWQRHKLRARIIAAATALDLEATGVERPKQSVLVHPGIASEGPIEDTAVIDRISAQLRSREGALFAALLRPAAGPLPAGATLEAGEKLFLGPWSPDGEQSQIDATASVRFALIGLSTAPLPEDPTKTRDVGRFVLLRLFQQGTERKWMEKPLEQRFGVGDVLAVKKVDIPNPFGGEEIRVDLDTPFVIEKLIKDQPRVLYWMVKPKARPGGGKGRDLELDKKEVKTDIVVLKNPDSGLVKEYGKLINIVPPTKPDTVIYPYFPSAYVEKDEFTKAPSEFRQQPLVPEAPKAFQPNSGPLEELYKAKLAEGALDIARYRTDTAYYAFPDGRLVWWDLVGEAVKIHDPDGVTMPRSATPKPELPTPSAPDGKGENRPQIPPGALPPGMMPPGMMPPGVKPPAGKPPGTKVPPPVPR